MAITNKHGLSRTIPDPIKRQVRQECGFGCVCCGMAISQYEHIDPEYNEATEHDPNKIALLCASCHDKVTRGIWSKDKVKADRANPITFARGFSKDAFDIGDPFILQIGSSIFHNVRTIVRTREGQEWLTIEPPEEPGAPCRLSGKFYDVDGNLLLHIDQNEWICPSTVWDLEVEGPRLCIRQGHRDIVLLLVAEPPHGLKVERLKMNSKGFGVEIDGDTLTLVNGGMRMSFTGCYFGNVNTVVQL